MLARDKQKVVVLPRLILNKNSVARARVSKRIWRRYCRRLLLLLLLFSRCHFSKARPDVRAPLSKTNTPERVSGVSTQNLYKTRQTFAG